MRLRNDLRVEQIYSREGTDWVVLSDLCSKNPAKRRVTFPAAFFVSHSSDGVVSGRSCVADPSFQKLNDGLSTVAERLGFIDDRHLDEHVSRALADVYESGLIREEYPWGRSRSQSVLNRMLNTKVANRIRGIQNSGGASKTTVVFGPHAPLEISQGLLIEACVELLSRSANDQVTVVIVAPSHRFRGPYISTFDGELETQVGRTQVDEPLVRKLVERSGEQVRVDARHFLGEHSIFVPLGVLQATARVLDVKLLVVPLLMPMPWKPTLVDRKIAWRPNHKLADDILRLAQVLGDSIDLGSCLWFASGDLTHYGPFYGFTPRKTVVDLSISDDVLKYDKTLLAPFLSGDYRLGVNKSIQVSNHCGPHALGFALAASQVSTGKIIDHSFFETSADDAGNLLNGLSIAGIRFC